MIRICPVCEKTFDTHYPNKKYCSYSCYLEVQNSQLSARYNDLKSRGICVYCGKSKAEEGSVACRKCKLYRSEMWRINYRHKRKASGL